MGFVRFSGFGNDQSRFLQIVCKATHLSHYVAASPQTLAKTQTRARGSVTSAEMQKACLCGGSGLSLVLDFFF